MHFQQATYPSGTTQKERALVEEALSLVKQVLERGPWFPPFASTDMPSITGDEMLYTAVFVTDTGKPAILVPGSPNAWKYFDGSAV